MPDFDSMLKDYQRAINHYQNDEARRIKTYLVPLMIEGGAVDEAHAIESGKVLYWVQTFADGHREIRRKGVF